MKLVILILALSSGALVYPVMVYADETSSGNSVFVYKLDGTMQCEDLQGASLESMEYELTSSDIKVLSSRKGYDGREGIAVCGQPTGQINIYEVLASDLSTALGLGYKQVPTH